MGRRGGPGGGQMRRRGGDRWRPEAADLDGGKGGPVETGRGSPEEILRSPLLGMEHRRAAPKYNGRIRQRLPA